MRRLTRRTRDRQPVGTGLSEREEYESWKEQRFGVLNELVWYNLKDLEQRVREEM